MDISRALYEAGETPARAARHLMRAHKVKDHLPPKTPDADKAFFGGRVQLFRRGTFQGPIYRYDMRSAYPWALANVHLLFDAHCRVFSWGSRECILPRYPFREGDGTVGYPPFGRGRQWVWRRGIVAVLKAMQQTAPGPFGYLGKMLDDPRCSVDEPCRVWVKQTMRCTWGSLLLPGFECYSLEWAGLATEMVHSLIYEAVEPYAEYLLSWNVDSVTATVPITTLPIGPGMGQFRETVLDALTIDPGAFGPRIGHPEVGTDRWLSYWPSVVFRDPSKESAPYVYRRGNPAIPYAELRQAGL